MNIFIKKRIIINLLKYLYSNLVYSFKFLHYKKTKNHKIKTNIIKKNLII